MWPFGDQAPNATEAATPTSLLSIGPGTHQTNAQSTTVPSRDENTDIFASAQTMADTEMADLHPAGSQSVTTNNAATQTTHTQMGGQSDPVTDAAPESEPEPEPEQRRSSLLDAAVENLLLKAERLENRESLTTSHWGDLKCVQTAQDDFDALFSKGDTWIIINVPSGHEPNIMCNEQKYPLKQRLRFDSAIFQQRGFGKIGETLSNEKYQAKLRRRLVSYGEIIPEDIKYLVDLGPSTDEELAPEQLEALSLSKGLMRWFIAPECYPGIPNSVVGGHDDCCTCESSFADARMIQPKPKEDPDGLLPEKKSNIWDVDIVSSFRKIDDYCEVRHAANVVRLLRAMAGKGLLLDSAPRVYTIAGLAKLFGFDPVEGGSWLQSEIWSWFFDEKNVVFLEVLPEESLKIATNLKIPIIARAAFRILVAEKALEVAAGGPQSRASHKSVFGRPLGDIDDDMRTAVEHASHGMAARVKTLLDKLRVFEVYDHLNIGEWNQVCEVWNYLQLNHPDVIPSLEGAFFRLTWVLTDWFTKRLFGTSSQANDVTYVTAIERNLKYLTPSANKANLTEVYRQFTSEQKALTATYWRTVRELWPNYQIFCSSKIDSKGETLEQIALKFNNALLNIMQAKGVDLNYIFPKPFSYHPSQSLNTQPWRFNTLTFYDEATACLSQICNAMFDPAHYKCEFEIPVKYSDHLLLSIEETELRFLPLWAGGYDDGTGGVFTDTLPAAEMGPNGPGPSYHTGHTVATDASVTDDMGFERLNVRSVTSGEGHSSNVVQDSLSTVYNRIRVMAMDDESIAPDDSFSVALDSEFDDAMHAVPADHQARGDALFEYVMQEQDDTSQSSEAPIISSGGGDRKQEQSTSLTSAAGSVNRGFDLGDDAMDVSSDSGTITPSKASVDGSDSVFWTVL